jgi:glycosyltransferase involved in cell wall biosynthesis
MFEYMASGRVQLASDLPILREVLDDSNAYLADYADENKWLEAINSIRNDKETAILKAEKARKDVEQYTWRNRARRMLELAVR